MATLTPFTVGNATTTGAGGTNWTSAPNGALGDNSDATFGYVSTNTTGTYIHGWLLPTTWADTDFTSMLTLSTVGRYRWVTAPTNTTWNTLRVKIVDSAGTTDYTNWLTIASSITTTTITDSASTGLTLTAAGLAAGKAAWESSIALVEIVRTRSKSGGSQQQAVYELDFTGTYSTANNYDERGKLTTVVSVDAHTTAAQWADLGNLTTVVSVDTHTDGQPYVELGNATTVVSVDASSDLITYGELGNLTTAVTVDTSSDSLWLLKDERGVPALIWGETTWGSPEVWGGGLPYTRTTIISTVTSTDDQARLVDETVKLTTIVSVVTSSDTYTPGGTAYDERVKLTTVVSVDGFSELVARGELGNLTTAVTIDAASTVVTRGELGNLTTVVSVDAATDAQAMWDRAAGYLVLDGTSGNYASVPDHADFDITTDIDIRVLASLDDLTVGTGEYENLLIKRKNSAEAFAFRLGPSAGFGLEWVWWKAASATVRVSSAQPSSVASDGEMMWWRVTFDADNGSSQNVTKFYYSSNGTSWNQLGTTLTSGGVQTIDSTTADIGIGGWADGPSNEFTNGRIHAVKMYADLAESDLRLDADFTDLTAAEVAAASFVEDSPTGHTVTLNGSAWAYVTDAAKLTTIVSVVTSSDTYTPGGTNYDERGKLSTVVSVDAATDTAALVEASALTTVVSVDAATDAASRSELTKLTTAIVVDAASDLFIFGELDNLTTIVSVDASSDAYATTDSVSTVIVSVDTETDQYATADSVATVIVSVDAASDAFATADSVATVVVSVDAATDALAVGEVGNLTTAVSSDTSSDIFDGVGSDLTTIVSVDSASDTYIPLGGTNYDERPKLTTIVSVDASSDVFDAVDSVSTVVVSVDAASNLLSLTEAAATVVVSVDASSDVFDAVSTGSTTIVSVDGANVLVSLDESANLTTIVSVDGGADVAAMLESAATTCVAVDAHSTVQAMLQPTVLTLITSVVSSYDFYTDNQPTIVTTTMDRGTQERRTQSDRQVTTRLRPRVTAN